MSPSHFYLTCMYLCSRLYSAWSKFFFLVISFKDWHMRQILSFASKVVRTNNPEPVAKYILDHIFYNDPNDNNMYPYDPALADFRLHKGWNIQFFPSTHRVNFFPANLRLLFKAIPQHIVNLFGTYAFDDLLTKHIFFRCKHNTEIFYNGTIAQKCL